MKNIKKTVAMVLLIAVLAALPGIATWAFDFSSAVWESAYGIDREYNGAVDVNADYTFDFAKNYAYRLLDGIVDGFVYNFAD